MSITKPSKNASKNGVVVKGIDNCLVKLAKCCNPLPGDNIIGYITKGRGVSVHRVDCTNAKNLLDEDNRMIDVYWNDKLNSSYNAEIEVYANDRDGLLKDIIKQLESAKAKMMGINAKANKEGIVLIEINLELQNKDELDKVLKTLRNVYSVYDVKRKK